MVADPEIVQLRQEINRWKRTCTNIMDQYSDLLTAAGIQGHAFFSEDHDDIHDEAVARMKRLVKRQRTPTLSLPKPISSDSLRKETK